MFKILSFRDGKLGSFNSPIDNLLGLEYKVNKWTYPNITNSKLFVFETCEEAIQYACNFFNPRSNKRIYNCSVVNPVKRRFIHGDYTFRSTGCYSIELPYGTVLCDSVMIHDLVERW